MKLPNKDMTQLAEAYMSIYNLNESMPEPSREGEAILHAMMKSREAREAAKAFRIACHALEEQYPQDQYE